MSEVNKPTINELQPSRPIELAYRGTDLRFSALQFNKNYEIETTITKNFYYTRRLTNAATIPPIEAFSLSGYGIKAFLKCSILVALGMRILCTKELQNISMAICKQHIHNSKVLITHYANNVVPCGKCRHLLDIIVAQQWLNLGIFVGRESVEKTMSAKI